jgi:hypothetical protein
MCLALQAHPALSAQQPEDVFRPLPAETQKEFDRQRAYVASLVAKHLPGKKLTRTKADFEILQSLVDLRVVPKDKTWELQALGIVFSDALAGTIPGLAWVEVTDKYGTDPTLRYNETSVKVNALNMISKRVRNGEKVDIAALAAWVERSVTEE